MEVWFYLQYEPRLRGRGEEFRKDLRPRSSVARQESFCPLDKDLSRKSRYRISGIAGSAHVRFPRLSGVDLHRGLKSAHDAPVNSF